jgi:quercetin dioxygenase-like cupin family protein
LILFFWHKHSTAQVIIILDGERYIKKEGVVLKKGDIIKCDKNIEHWRISTTENKVIYIAVYGSEP